MDTKFDKRILNIGFLTALVLATVCLIASALYLNRYLASTNEGVEKILDYAIKVPGPTAGQTESAPAPATPPSKEILDLAITARVAMARFTLLSCGVFIGMAFGFLGFALFLLGIKGEMDAEATTGKEGYSVKLARLSPGLFVILCATLLIGVCMTRKTGFELTQTPKAVQKANKSEEHEPSIGVADELSEGGAEKDEPKTP